MHKHDKKIKTRTIHICLTDINCSGLRSFSSTFITVYRAHCSLVDTVQRIIFIIYIYQEGFVSISHRYGSTQSQCKECLRKTHDSVSISHRYGSTVGVEIYEDTLEIGFQSLIGTVQQLPVQKPRTSGKSFNLS